MRIFRYRDASSLKVLQTQEELDAQLKLSGSIILHLKDAGDCGTDCQADSLDPLAPKPPARTLRVVVMA